MKRGLLLLLLPLFLFAWQGGKYGIRFSLGADSCDVYDNDISDSSRYGVFFFRGSDEAEVSSSHLQPTLPTCVPVPGRRTYGGSNGAETLLDVGSVGSFVQTHLLCLFFLDKTPLSPRSKQWYFFSTCVILGFRQ